MSAFRLGGVLLLLWSATDVAAQAVWAVTANAGSLGGGTKVLISGTGFNRNGVDGNTIV